VRELVKKKKQSLIVGFEVLIAVTAKSTIFWTMMSYSKKFTNSLGECTATIFNDKEQAKKVT
jgi:hypothetical protein